MRCLHRTTTTEAEGFILACLLLNCEKCEETAGKVNMSMLYVLYPYHYCSSWQVLAGAVKASGRTVIQYIQYKTDKSVCPITVSSLLTCGHGFRRGSSVRCWSLQYCGRYYWCNIRHLWHPQK